MLTPHILVFNAGDLVFDAKHGFFVINVLAVVALSHDLGSLAIVAFQDADSRIGRRVRHIKAISCGAEDGIAHCSFFG